MIQDLGDAKFYIGPAGWSYPDWNGIVYPKRKGASFDPLVFLSDYFNLIEINSTFYRIPEPRICRRWVERVESRPDFQFSIKVFNEFTHSKRRAEQVDIDGFKRAISPVFEAGRLGMLLIQFPWSFRFSADTRAYVQWLNDGFAPFPIVTEVRHGTWGSPEALSFFRDNALNMCGIDQPAIGNSLASDVFVPADDRAYFRFHGRNYKEWFKSESNRDARYNYLYTASELEEWAVRLRTAAEKLKTIFVVLNNHFQGQAAANGLELKALLSGGKVSGPAHMTERFPQLASVTEPDDRWSVPPSRGQAAQPSLFDKKEQKEDTSDNEDR